MILNGPQTPICKPFLKAALVASLQIYASLAFANGSNSFVTFQPTGLAFLVADIRAADVKHVGEKAPDLQHPADQSLRAQIEFRNITLTVTPMSRVFLNYTVAPVANTLGCMPHRAFAPSLALKITFHETQETLSIHLPEGFEALQMEDQKPTSHCVELSRLPGVLSLDQIRLFSEAITKDQQVTMTIEPGPFQLTMNCPNVREVRGKWGPLIERSPIDGRPSQLQFSKIQSFRDRHFNLNFQDLNLEQTKYARFQGNTESLSSCQDRSGHR